MEDCSKDHRFFVADVVGVPDEGTVHVLLACTACGGTKMSTFKVSQPKVGMILKSQEK